MLQEKDIVNDVLGGLKSSLGNYAKVIAECSNQNLRSTFQQMRDGDEKFQYDLYKIAEQKGYYTCGPSANSAEMGQLKSQLSAAGSIGSQMQ